MKTSQKVIEETLFVACWLEATARKPGNVHPNASFDDSCYLDFINSAKIIAPILSHTQTDSVGTAILEAVTATRNGVGNNTNLGIILLLAPLASIPISNSIASKIELILDSMTVEDSKLIYRAINHANPAGMGKNESQDLSNEPTEPFREIMSLVADRDSIARAYSNAYADLIPDSSEEIQNQVDQLIANCEETIIRWQLEMMATLPDTLILRKCGKEIADLSAEKASEIFKAGWPNSSDSRNLLIQFDNWLRADGNKRNPGTTADLIAAKLFILLRETHEQNKTQQFIQEILNDVE